MVPTSTSNSLSLCFNEQALLSAWTRSLIRPCLGTVTVQGDGRAAPSQEKTVTVMVLLAVEDWSGRERYMNGSNVTETLLQTGQTKVDLYCPCKMNYQKHIQVSELHQERHKM